MFHSTTTQNFQSWDKFLDAYYGPIRTALGLIPYIGENRADDVAQSFFVKMHEKGILEKRPAITGRFRNWLYVAARRHAIDEWRKIARRPERPDAFETNEPVETRAGSPDEAPFDADEFYALSILHMTVGRVHQHLLDEGKSEHWMIFEELVLAPIIPGRVPKTRAELLGMFPGQAPIALDNRVTTVKRVFRRILAALIPADPTESLTPEERFEELLEILRSSKNNRLWLAFLTDPQPGPEEGPGSSMDLLAPSSTELPPDAMIDPEILHDELRVLLAFWLERPLYEYLDQLEGAGPAVTQAIRDARPTGHVPRRSAGACRFNLKELVAGTLPAIAAIPAAEQAIVFARLKTFAKRVHSAVNRQEKEARSRGETRRENSMPLDVAQVLYNLAGALALTRCRIRIIGLGSDRYRKNVTWVLSRPWLDTRLRPVFFETLKQLETAPLSEQRPPPC
jgi:DNA-directed RNA polymerase specialized sigma24 family protein